jgi:capsular polysaccharide biosynthesis protein
VNDTEIFAVNISHADPKVAKAVADAIADTAPEAISSIIKSSSAAIVSRARMPRAPYTPNTRQSAVYGTFLGVMMAVAYVILRVLMDVRVKGEEDLALISDAPVLGVIPNFDAEERNSYSYQSSQSGNQNKAVEK